MNNYFTIPKVDTHSHFVTKSYLDTMNKYLGGNPDRYPMPEWSADSHLEFMDSMGIVHSVISPCPSPHHSFVPAEACADFVRADNETGAEVVRKHPGKFSQLAALPVLDVEASLAEIAYACDKLHVDGFMLPTNALGLYIGNSRLKPIFDELNRRKALVALHPNKPSAVPEGVAEKMPIPMMEFFFDTTRTVVDLMLNGYITQYNDIKFMVPHCGAMLPYIVDRIESFKPTLIKTGTITPDFDVLEVFSKIYFDLAGDPGRHQLGTAMDMVDESHFFYASDYPFTARDVIVASGENLFNSPGLRYPHRMKIAHDNAARIFPRAAKIASPPIAMAMDHDESSVQGHAGVMSA
jgi:6-methylsalicylate decarboxylase